MKALTRLMLFVLLTTFLFLHSTIAVAANPKGGGVHAISLTPPAGKAIAVFSQGCFWYSVLMFEDVVGVDSAIAGYAGGKTVNPSYEDVTTETTGHAESVAVYYDPAKISYAELLNVFFISHDPTTLNRQGNDAGTSYRSVVYYANDNEKEQQKTAMDKWNKSGTYKNPIVTQVLPLTVFYRAEDYHQHFAQKNPTQGYISAVSIPHFKQFKSVYKGKLKGK